MHQETHTNVRSRGEQPVGMGQLWYIHTMGYCIKISTPQTHLTFLKLIKKLE